MYNINIYNYAAALHRRRRRHVVMVVCDKYLHTHTHTHTQIYIVYDIVGKVLKQAIKEDVYTTRAVTIKHERVCACVRKIQHWLRNSGLKMCLVDVAYILSDSHTYTQTHTHICSRDGMETQSSAPFALARFIPRRGATDDSSSEAIII